METDTEIEEPTLNEPALVELERELADTLTFAGQLTERQDVARDVRFAQWPGQSEDGRVHEDDTNEKPFPWEGASDTRIFLADDIINEQVAILVAAFFRAEIHAMPTKAQNLPRATAVMNLLRWLRNVKLRGELVKQVNLFAQYMLGDDPGVCVVGVYWRKQEQMELVRISLPEIIEGLAEQERERGDGRAAAAAQTLVDVIQDEERAPEALGALAQGFPTVKPAGLRKALKELRTNGETQLPRPRLVRNLPCVVTYRLNETIFLPEGCTDIQSCDALFTVQRLTRAQVRAKVREDGWEEEAVLLLLAHGEGQRYHADLRAGTSDSEERTGPVNDKKFEVWTGWRRGSDESGVPWVWRTVWSPAANTNDAGEKLALQHEPHAYHDGDLPFYLFQREYLGDSVFDSRGITRIAATSQTEIKAQRDCRVDYTELATVPPVKKAMRRAALKLVFGPAAEIPMDRGDDVAFMTIPPFPQASVEMEGAVRRDADQYFGRESKDTAPSKVELVRTKLALESGVGWAWIFQQMLYLCQQNMAPELVYAVAGVDPQVLSKDDVGGDYELQVAFDVRELNLEYLQSRMKYFTEVLGLDAGGTIDRNMLVRVAMRGIDPNLGDLLVRDTKVATAKEADEEVNDIAKLAVGIEVPPPEAGNWSLRLKVLEETVLRSPQLQAKAQQDQAFAKGLGARRDAYVFQLQQEENAQIGRTGFMPTQAGSALAARGAPEG